MTTTSFRVNERVTNARGAWATLRYDPYGGAGQGVFYAEVYATNFTADLASAELSANRRRAPVERGMRQWLAGR